MTGRARAAFFISEIKEGSSTDPNHVSGTVSSDCSARTEQWDAKLYNKGDIEQAYQKGQTVHLGMLTDADGTPTADSILQTVEAAMTDYDRAWCADMKEFFDNYTTKLINETSLQLVGYQRATVKNYYPIAVDKSCWRPRSTA